MSSDLKALPTFRGPFLHRTFSVRGEPVEPLFFSKEHSKVPSPLWGRGQGEASLRVCSAVPQSEKASCASRRDRVRIGSPTTTSSFSGYFLTPSESRHGSQRSSLCSFEKQENRVCYGKFRQRCYADRYTQYTGYEWWEFKDMTETGKKLLDTFDSLPENERQEVALEILRRTAFAEHNVPSESELTAAAD